MFKTKVTIQVHSTSALLEDNTIMLGDPYIKVWKLPKNQALQLRFGSTAETVKVIGVPRYKGLRITPPLARKLGLRNGMLLHLSYKPSNQTLAIGPLIGILTGEAQPGDNSKLFGAYTAFCKEIVDACQQQGAYVYIFTPDQLGRNNSSLEGWTYYSGSWHKASFPIPDVVHNRLSSRKSENKANVQHFMKDVKARFNTCIFNEKFLSKSEVFQALKHDPEISSHMPESHLLQRYDVFRSMNGKYSSVFLKPVHGSMGRGIIRVSRNSDGMYQCNETGMNGFRKQSYPTLAKVYSAIAGKMKARKYLIQQGLNLITVANRPVDFRALVQKNGNGKWAITSIVARTAGVNHFVSNLARGGTLSTVNEALAKSQVGASTQTIAAKLRMIALDIAEGVEKHVPGHFGELGVDLAVDRYGKVWLLEVNSKPSKSDNTPLTPGRIRPSVKQIIHYARYLSGF